MKGPNNNYSYKNNYNNNYNKGYNNYGYNKYNQNYNKGYGNNYGYNKPYYNDNKYNYQNKPYYNKNRVDRHEIEVPDVETVTKSDEVGFTGSPDTWFSDEEYFKQLQGTSDYDNKKDYYFHSYSSFYVHESMLKDRIRTESYKKAIDLNKDLFKDKVVLDIGCGTGVLSIFAAKAGAKKVYGIDFADIADYAKQIVKDNGLEDKVVIFKSKVEDANIPEQVDFIISEWMGYFLLFESMLDCVLYARDKWLKKDGKILPDKASMYISAIEDVQYRESKVDFWNDVYKVNMSCMKNNVLCEPLVEIAPRKSLISSTCKFFEINLNTCKVEDLEFANEYCITFNKNDTCSGLVTWFDVEFNLPNRVVLSTSPKLKETHWRQTIFYAKDNFKVQNGDVLKGSISVTRSKDNFRDQDIKLSYHVLEGGKNEKGKWIQMYKIR